ncbi:hypothetical protein [Streptomyces luteogriseus]|uniref:hypothetical protein n=1 Tax=Streptomyces luteogriseus TaxID=68233 RepID=UPI0037F17E4C
MGRITRKYKAEVSDRAAGKTSTVEGEVQVDENVPLLYRDSDARDQVRVREGRGAKTVTRVEIDGKDVPWHC